MQEEEDRVSEKVEEAEEVKIEGAVLERSELEFGDIEEEDFERQSKSDHVEVPQVVMSR